MLHIYVVAVYIKHNKMYDCIDFLICTMENTRNEFCHLIIALWLPPLNSIFYNTLLLEEGLFYQMLFTCCFHWCCTLPHNIFL